MPVVFAGPPWRAVQQPTADQLAFDPPVSVVCDTWAAGSAALSALERAGSEREAVARAHVMAYKGDGFAMVFQGCMRLRSGRYLWVHPRELVQVDKALNPLNRRQFMGIVEELRRRLDSASGSAEARAFRKAARRLGINWTGVGRRQQERVVNAVGDLIQGISNDRQFLRVMNRIVPDTTMRVARDSRRVVRRADIRARLSRPDQQVARRIGKDTTAFLTDEYGRRRKSWDRDARRIITADMRRGLGSADIADRLERTLGDKISGRSPWYYQIVAGAAVSRARSWGQTTGYRDAGIAKFSWEAVGDEVTCPICVFLDGKEFNVDVAQDRFDRADNISDPEEAIKETPWYRVKGDRIYVAPRGEPLGRPVAQILQRPTEGSGGRFRELRSTEGAGGTTMPPAHGSCRCTTLPVV